MINRNQEPSEMAEPVSADKMDTAEQAEQNRPVPRLCQIITDDMTASCAATNDNWTRMAFGSESSDIELIAVGDHDFRTVKARVPSIRLNLMPYDSPPASTSSTPLSTSPSQHSPAPLSPPEADTYTKTTLRGHNGPVYGLTFLESQTLMVSCSEDASVRLWNTDTGKLLDTYYGHSYPIWCTSSSALGIYFATGSTDMTARIWRTGHPVPMRTLVGHTQDVHCVQFHPNTKYVATGSSDKTIRMWNIQDGRVMRLFGGHFAPVNAIAFAPNGQWLASAGEDLRIRIWDIGSGRLLKDIAVNHSDQITGLSFNDDSTLIASASADKTVKVWELRPKTVEINNNASGTKETKTTCAFDHLRTFAPKHVILSAQFARRENCNSILALLTSKKS